MLGEGSQMGDKCSVKKSVIGRHCRIGSNVKVFDMLLAIWSKNKFILTASFRRTKVQSRIVENQRFYAASKRISNV